MELRHLRYFIAVAENEGFGQAARLLNVSQSAISEQVRDLEHELKVSLFDRSNRRIALTVQGRKFLEDARSIIALSQQAIEDVQRSLRGEIGTLNIGFFIGGIGSFFPALIKEFRKRFPGVTVHLVEMQPGLQHRALKNATIDIGFTRPIQPVDAKLLSSEFLQTEAMYVAFRKEHPLAKKRSILIRELSQERFILNDRQYSASVFDKVITLCAEAGFSPTLGANATDSLGAMALVQAGEGITLLPNGSRLLGAENLVFVPVADPAAKVDMVVAWSSAHERPLIRSFLEMVRKRQPITAARRA